jgi:uncharacterized protein YbjT (DUF2867 family)
MGEGRGLVLVLGASGFIGARVAAQAAAQGYRVRAGARDPRRARRRFPGFNWVRADFAELASPGAWAPLLEGVDAVVNCVGVLQDAAGDSSKVAHVSGPRALISACERARIRRFVHISAIGADEDAGTRYARDKLETERMLAASSLDWIVVRPSLVVAREVYGGTALVRGLAGLPGLIPLVGAERTFRPIHAVDLAELVVAQVAAGTPARVVIEAAGPETVSLKELVRAYRSWLGFPDAPVIDVPPWAAWPVLKLGDLAGWLGWTSPIRTTSFRQLLHGAAGREAAPPDVRPFLSALWTEPAGVQDRWHARLYVVRPLAVILLGLFWMVSGLVALGPGAGEATGVLARGGLASSAAPAATAFALIDIVLGALIFVRRCARFGVLGMLYISALYLATASVRLTWLWADPLGPLVKVVPMMALCLVVLATEDRR